MAGIPHTFAILQEDTSAVQNFSVYRARQVSEGVIYRFAHIENPGKCIVHGVDTEANKDPVLVSVRFQHFTLPTIIVAGWNTGLQVLCPTVSDRPIPVYDFMHRNFLFLEPFNQTCDTSCKELIRDQIVGRSVAYKWISKYWPVSSYSCVYDPPVIKGTPLRTDARPEAGAIPNFVVEALIQQEPAPECPITYIPLKDCKTVSTANCFHCFEKGAIQQWIAINNSCPACKAPIRELTDYTRMIAHTSS